MRSKPHSMYLISDFTVDSLKDLMANSQDFKPLIQTFNVAPFGQSKPELIKLSKEDVDKDSVFVWCLPEKISLQYNELLTGNEIDKNKIDEDIIEFCNIIRSASKNIGIILIAEFVNKFPNLGLGAIENRPPNGLSYVIDRMNLLVREGLSSLHNVFILDTKSWIISAGQRAYSPASWFMAKVPFSLNVFKEASLDILSTLSATKGKSKKLIILDLDDTLWGGILGDDGIEGINLGGHDPIGEAFVEFQKHLITLNRRGILLAISSKNNEQLALDTINNHEGMALSLDDFSAWRINWHDKAENIIEICTELNIGLHSVVFIDDNPAERGRVREALPDVLVPNWPKSPMMYVESLNSLRCFDFVSLTNEDKNKTKMYQVEKQRQDAFKLTSSVEEWRKELSLNVKVSQINESNCKRVVQLLNKTNQLNLSTRRLNEIELNKWLHSEHRKLWTFSVSDKYGDSGLVGIMSIDILNNEARLIDFVLSCRVFNREIEKVMLEIAISYSSNNSVTSLIADYIETEKNRPTLDFLNQNAFKMINETRFIFNKSQLPMIPEYMKIEVGDYVGVD
jgi:FkbH-like protein